MAVNLAVIVIVCLLLDSLLRRLRLPGPVGMLGVGIVAGPHVLDLSPGGTEYSESRMLKPSHGAFLRQDDRGYR